MENKVKFILFGIIMLLLVFFIGIVSIFHKDSSDDKKTKDSNIVSDYNIYFAIQNNINKYIRFTYENSEEEIYAILNKRFTENNNINTSNVKSKIDIYAMDSVYEQKYLESVEVTDLYNVFYSRGNLIDKSGEEEKILIKNIEFIIAVDYNTMAINLYPIQSNNHEEIINDLKDNSTGVKLNNYNKFEGINPINKNSVCVMYLSDYYFKMFNSPDEALKYTKNYDNIDEFIELIDRKNFDASVLSCELTEEKGIRKYFIKDMNENSYTFIEKSIMNYEVII